jgi:hypothetical protein
MLGTSKCAGTSLTFSFATDAFPFQSITLQEAWRDSELPGEQAGLGCFGAERVCIISSVQR